MCIEFTGWVIMWKFRFIFCGESVVLIEMFYPRRCVIHTQKISRGISIIQTRRNKQNPPHCFPLFGQPYKHQEYLTLSWKRRYFLLSKECNHQISKKQLSRLCGTSSVRVCSIALSVWGIGTFFWADDSGHCYHGPWIIVQVKSQWCGTIIQTCGIVPLGRTAGCHSV